jgi:hypothetical protein
MTTPVDEAKLEPEVEPDEPEDGYNEPPKLKINIKKLLALDATKTSIPLLLITSSIDKRSRI